MFLTLEIETEYDFHLVTFEGTPDKINNELRGFFNTPCKIHNIIVIGSDKT